MLAAKTAANPVLPTARSATGVTAVTATMFVLFSGLGSPVAAVLDALFVKGPKPGAVSTTRKFVTPPGGNDTTRFVTGVPPGSVSTTTTLLATDGPRFVTEIVFVYVAPANTFVGPAFPSTTSATGVTVVVTGGLVLLVGVGSAVGELIVAVFVIVPLAGAVTVKVRFVIAFAAKVPNDQLTVPAAFVPFPLALKNTTFVGSASLATTLLAVPGPAFVTVMV